MIHKKSVNFYELNKNWVFFLVPFIDKMMIYGSSFHTVSNFHEREKAYFRVAGSIVFIIMYVDVEKS